MNAKMKKLAVWLAACMLAGCAGLCVRNPEVKAAEKQEETAEKQEEAVEKQEESEKPAADAAETQAAGAEAEAVPAGEAATDQAAVLSGPFVTEETPLRKEASAEAEELLVLAINSQVEVLEPGDPEDEESFAKISFEGQEGYIPASFIGDYPVRYTTENLTLRAQADKESEKLTIVALNKKVPVLELGNPEEEGGYSRILYKGQEGYVLTKYLTENAEEALQAEKEADAYEAAKAAAAERAASRRRSYDEEDDEEDYDYDDEDEDEVYEVNREKFDDCDGSGHGYYEITYSDGSTEIVEY